ncbi:MAG: ABC transporter ATP-binding protein [Euzebyales bacterium]|nr:ABC transporter ATP-binding protein [Euzebyales bacterium]
MVGRTTLLASTTFTVGKGEALAIVGPSGSGKTTLLGCVSGTVVPSRGSVVVGGTEVSSLAVGARARFRRNHVGPIFQDPELLDELSVVENVALSLIFSGVARTEALRRAAQLLERLGMGAHVEARTATLSGGEAQRVAVARALVKRSAIVVADEPTASLDAEHAAEVTQLLITTARESGTALLLATHDVTVASECDRVLSLREEQAGAA